MADAPRFINRRGLIKGGCEAQLSYAINKPVEFTAYNEDLKIKDICRIYAKAERDGYIPAIGMIYRANLIDRDEWDIKASSSQRRYPARYAIDNNRYSFWHSRRKPIVKYPYDLVVDMKEQLEIKGFTYLPGRDLKTKDIVSVKDYEFYTSSDGQKWEKTASGQFDGGRKIQKVLFEKPVKAGYFKIVFLSAVKGGNYSSCADINVLLK
jgi:hypothetical protein